MAVITYIAARSLVAGHTAGDEYAIEIPFSRWDRVAKREAETIRTLSGNSFTRLHRIDTSYDAGTVPVDDTALINQMREFLASVAGGEEFTVDPLGTIAAPDQEFAVEIEGDPTESRQQNFWFSFQFRVRAL